MTHNQVNYLLGKRNADISQENTDIRREELDVKRDELGLERKIANKNIRSNETGMAIGTTVAVVAIVTSIIIACFW